MSFLKKCFATIVAISAIGFSLAPVANVRGGDIVLTPSRATISFKLLTVSYLRKTGQFAFQDTDGKEFAIEVKEEGKALAPATLDIVDLNIPNFERGLKIVANHGQGKTTSVGIVPGLPFALVQQTVTAGKEKDKTIDFWPIISLETTLTCDGKEAKVLGTGGLSAPDGTRADDAFRTGKEKPIPGKAGSYAFLAAADPKTRAGVVTGFISADRGCGVVFSKMNKGGKVQIDAQVDYGKLLVRKGKTAKSEIYAVGYFKDARIGLEKYADAVKQYYDIKLPKLPTGYCTWYSNPHGRACDEKHIKEWAEDAATRLKPYGFDFIQIDDFWQAGPKNNGPRKQFFTHNPKGPYPNGMKGTAEMIKKLGMTPGIWFMPFAADRKDPFFQKHSEWLVKNPDGTPYWVNWGGTSLDMTHPGAQKYLRENVRRIAKDWGYTYFKMDGLWVGSATALTYINNGYVKDDIGTAVLHNPDKTNIEAYRDGLKIVREEAGPDVFFLGCNISQNMRTLPGSYGLVDAMRVGPDNGPGFKSLLRGPWHSANRYFYHGRVWYNDPDPIYMRASMPMEHARLNCAWVALTGHFNVFSEWLPGLPEDRLELLRRTMPNHGLSARPIDLFESDIPGIWLLSDTRKGKTRRDIVGLFNWNKDEPMKVDISLERIGLPQKSYVGYDFFGKKLVSPINDRLQCEVPPGDCLIISLRPTPTDQPVVIGTSRHVASGIIDIVDEKWDAEKKILSGVSKIVDGDPYEARIVVPASDKPMQVAEVKLAHIGKKSGVNVKYSQNSNLVLMNLDSKGTGNREVEWEIRFQ